MKTFIEQFNLSPCSMCGSNHLKRVILLHVAQPNPMKVKCCDCGFEPQSFKADMVAAALEWNEIGLFFKQQTPD